ncbi:unnamed protein product, partial [marine sediment metagenome]
KNESSVSKLFARSKKQKAMTMLVPGLLVVFTFVFTRTLSTSSPVTAELINLEPTSAEVSPGNKIDWQIPGPYPASLRDPMRLAPVTTGQTQSDQLQLIVKGIVHSKDKPSAIINGRIMREGEKISSATIVKINRSEVVFEMNGRKWAQKVQR